VSKGAPLIVDAERCTRCGKCVPVCAPKAIKPTDAYLFVDWQKCTGCLECVAACDEGALARTFAGARTSAQAAAAAQRQANVFVGGLTVSVITNVISGGAGSAVGGGMAGVATDLAVGGVLNYGQAQFQGGITDPRAGTKAAVTNSLSSLTVGLAEEMLEHKLGPAKEAIKVTRDALAAAGVQAVLDESVKREDERNKNKK